MAIGKVIKGDTPQDPALDPDRPALARPRAGVVSSENYEARQSALSIVATAQRQAAEILAEAHAQRDEILEKGREEGRQEGLMQVSEVLAKAHIQRDQMLVSAENEMIALACRMAEKIIGYDLKRTPEVVVDICATALENTRNAKQLMLRVNPLDGAVLRSHKQELQDKGGQVLAITIKDDSDVEPGGCIIQTDTSTIDARLSTQFEVLQNLLLRDHARKEDPK